MNARFDELIDEFEAGLGLGLDPRRRERDAPLTLEFERSGRLCVESVGESVLVHLVRDHGRSTAGLARRALALCHLAHRHPWPLQSGLLAGGSHLLLAFRLPLARARVPDLVESFDALRALHDRLDAECRP